MPQGKDVEGGKDTFYKAHHMRITLGPIAAFSHAVSHLRHNKKEHENSPADDLKALDCKDMVCVALLFITHVTVIFCRNFVNPLAAALVSDTWHYNNSKHTSALVVNGVAFGLGKIVNGIAVNALNPRVCLFFYIITSAAVVFFFSFIKFFAESDDDRYALLLGFWAVNSFLQSGSNSAFIKYTYERFRPEQYSSVFTWVCLGSRVGAVATSLSLGALLAEFAWPEVTKLAALITVCGALPLAVTFFPISDKPHPVPHDKDEHAVQAQKIREAADKTGCALYATWWRNPRFIFMVFSTGCLGTLSAVDAIVGLFIEQVFKPSLTVAGMMCACLPAGIVISIPFFAMIIPKLEASSQMKVIVTMLGVLVASILGVTVVTAVAESSDPDTILILIAGVLIFLYGFMLGYPYFIPPAVFALDFGHASGGMVATFIDLVSSVLCAILSIATGFLSGIGWVYVWILLLVLAAAAFVMLWYWHILNLRWIAEGRPHES